MLESYYRDQAALCAEEAGTSSLPRVRERATRAQEAWLKMADRAAASSRIKAECRT